jgi:DNA-binding transcriptional regulator YiaG
VTPEEISHRVAALIANLQAELARIDAKAGEERRAAIAASGLPVPLVNAVLGNSPLTQDASYATIATMSTNFATEPRKPGRPLGAGPVAKAAKKLRMSMVRLAEAIGCNENTVKAWNARGAIPVDAQAKIDALLAKAKRDTSK